MKRIIKWLEKNWWEFLIGTLLAGVLIEFVNANIYQIWVYKFPWDLYVIPFVNTSLVTLTLGWFLLALGAFVLMFVYEELRPDQNIEHAWVIGWIAMGFLYEIFNSKIWQTWVYPQSTVFGKHLIPFLDFSIFVPIVGYAGVGLISFWIIKYVMKYAKKK